MKIKHENIAPPKFGKWLLYKMICKNISYQAIGDFDEIFYALAEERGLIVAKVWYWIQIIKSFPSFLIDKMYWGFIMFKNYFKVAYRNIKRYKGFSFINIFGLAVGLTTCIFIMIFVRLELTYDSYHDGADRIYMVGLIEKGENGTNYRGSNHIPMRNVLADDYPQVESAARIMRMYEPSVRYQDKIFRENNFYRADQEFFDVFSVNFINGNKNNSLNRPSTAIVNETIAEKYFGNENPIGKILLIDEVEFEVTAVVENQPLNSIFQFAVLTTWLNLPERDHYIGWHPLVTPAMTFIKLNEDVDAAEFEELIENIPEQYLGADFNELGLEHLNYIQPLQDIHLYNETENGIEKTKSFIYVYIFSSVGILILLLACINFINLSTARSSLRACEVGMRKVIGAKRSSIIQQFLGESLLISGFSMLLALLFVVLLIPFFNKIAETKFEFILLVDPVIILGLLSVVIFVGLVSGSYPALIISGFQPISILRGLFNLSSNKTDFLRILVIGQFAISIILVIVTLFIYKQVNHMKESPLGFEKERKLVLALKNWDVIEENYEMVKDEFERHPSINSASVSSGVPGRMINRLFVNPSQDPNSSGFGPRIVRCDFDFPEVYKIKVLSGIEYKVQGIPEELRGNFYINETAMKNFGYSNPNDAVGKSLYIGSDREEFKIIGVIKDFYWFGLQNKIEPTIMRFVSTFRYITLNIYSHDLNKTLSFVKEKYSELFPNDVYEYFFIDRDFDRQYKKEENLASLFSIFTLLGLFIASLGLLGLATFITERRTKEIGIRKIMGASESKIIYILNKKFLMWILIANIIAWPVSFLIVDKWLQDFAYRVDIHISVFILATILTLIIASITVCYQSLKAARSNPINSLRYE